MKYSDKYISMAALVFFVFLIGGCWSMTPSNASANSGGGPVSYSISPTPRPSVSASAPTSSTPNKMDDQKLFYNNLPSGFVRPTDDPGKTILKEYGSFLLAKNGAVVPKKVVFQDEADVKAFQSTAGMTSGSVGKVAIELQAPAMRALLDAVEDARSGGLSITPRGSDPARRSYEQTVINWKGKVSAGFKHWVPARVSSAEAKRISAMSPYDQVPEIFKLEAQGIFFSLNFDKSIMFSVAPPGTSQHISGLALDVTEFGNARVRAVLAKHGWFQTIASDLPHFTYLGYEENELTGIGLKKVEVNNQTFWVPDI